MALDDDVLEQLRAVFREEKRAQLEALRRHRTVLDRHDASAAEQQSAIREAYRIAHTLKGAARSVGEERLVEACHHLESDIAPARSGHLVDPIVAAQAIDALLGGVPEDAKARTHRSPQPSPAEPEPPAAVVPSTEMVRVQMGQVQRLLAVADSLGAFVDGALAGRPNLPLAEFDRELRDLRRSARADAPRQELVERLEVTADRGTAIARALRLDIERRRGVGAMLREHIEQLAVAVRGLRVTSAAGLCASLERTCLSLSRELGKDVAFVARGGEVLVDRDVLERVWEPLMHVVGNAVDHGIEPAEARRRAGKPERGHIEMEVALAGTEVQFSVTDDGAGFDLEALGAAAERMALPVDGTAPRGVDLAFVAGLSTRTDATTTSGRGVGLDIVRSRVRNLQGTVDVRSRPGHGTTIVVRVPAELGGVHAIAVELRDHEYLLPLGALERVIRVAPEDVRTIDGATWVEIDGDLVPAAALLSVMGEPMMPLPLPRARQTGLLLFSGGRRAVAWVDRVLDVRHVLATPLSERAHGAAFVTAAVRTPEGRAIPVLDAAEILARLRPAALEPDRPEVPVRRVLVVDDSITTRQLVRVILEGAGYQVAQADNGERAWQRLLSEEAFDIVVSDIEMPLVDGLALLSRVRTHPRLRDLPLVLVTARADDEDRRRALALGADAYVVKSAFDQSTLLETIREVLA